MNLTKRSVLKQLQILSIIINIVSYPTYITSAPQYDDFFPPLPVDYYNPAPICPPILCPVIVCTGGFTLVEDPTGCTCARCECLPRFCPYIDCGKNDTMIPPCGCAYCEVPGSTVNNLNTTGIIDNNTESNGNNINSRSTETEVLNDKLTTTSTSSSSNSISTETNTNMASSVLDEAETESKETTKETTTSSSTTANSETTKTTELTKKKSTP